MLTWIKEHFTDQYQRMRDGIKYVFISFYEDNGCNNLLTGNNDEDSKAFSDVLNTLSGTFKNASVGLVSLALNANIGTAATTGLRIRSQTATALNALRTRDSSY